jgi:4-hydroxymandelate oxidase
MAEKMEPGMSRPWSGKEGVIPVTSGRADDANIIARNYLDSIQVEMRVIDSVKADLTTEIFGKQYASPIMTPAFSHLNLVKEDGTTPMEQYALAAKKHNVLNWVGMEPDEEFAKIAETGADCVRIIKPFKDHSRILEEMRFAEKAGAAAVGIDIDHVFGPDGEYDVVDGNELGPVSESDLMEYAHSTSLPFIAKGVLSVQDAEKCMYAGCAGIFVSHHHGRIPFGIAPVQALQEITEKVNHSMLVFADCHIDSGYDAYKALALGADAVSAGRTILAPLLKDGTDGVLKRLDKMDQELKMLMGYTGVKDVHSFDPSVLYRNGAHLKETGEEKPLL